MTADAMTSGRALAPVFSSEFLQDEASEREAEAARERVLGEIRRLGLEHHIGRLECDGYTVLSPEEVGPPEFAARVRDKVLELAARRSGKLVDVEKGESHKDAKSIFGQVQFEPSILGEDPIFEQALMNPSALALISYLLGESCVLSHISSMIKGPGKDYLELHCDQNQSGAPAPFPPFAQTANATWALTDYTSEGGAICMAPGSHKYCRPPTRQEATDLSRFVPIEVPAGSVIVFHGNTWHGALRRKAEGVRVSILSYFNRWYNVPLEGLFSRPSAEMLARNPERLQVLLGVSKPGQSIGTPQSRALKTSLFA